MKRLLKEISCKVTRMVQIKCDNESAMKLASNLVFHAMTKHIEIHHHFMREKMLSQEIKLKYVTKNQ